MIQGKEQYRDFLNEKFITNAYAATINIKTNDYISAEETTLRQFRRRYRQAIGRRTKHYFFIPSRETVPHLHYHLILNRPAKLTHEEYTEIFYKVIRKVKGVHRDYNDIKPIDDLQGWIKYVTKFRNKDDNIDWNNFRR